VRLLYNPREISGVTTDRPRVLQMVSEPTLTVFTGRLVEKDKMTYELVTWVRTYDV
jgi:hypothetical protein